MRKKILISLLTIIVLVMSIASLTILASCSKKVNIADYIADLSGAKGLAITKNASMVSAQSSQVASKDMNDSFLSTVDSNGEYSETEFKDKNNKATTLSDMNLFPVKMKTAGDFTFISIVPKSSLHKVGSRKEIYDGTGTIYYKEYLNKKGDSPCIVPIDGNYGMPTNVYDREYGVPQNYDSVGYVTYGAANSYAIYNKTGKVYSMSQFECFNIATDNTICTIYPAKSKVFYKLSVNEDNNLIIADLVPNKDIAPIEVVMANDGYRYILNDDLNMIDHADKTVFISDQKAENYYKDAKQNVYTGYGQKITNVMVNGEVAILDTTSIIPNISLLFKSKYYVEKLGYNNGWSFYSSDMSTTLFKDGQHISLTPYGSNYSVELVGENMEYLVIYDDDKKTLSYIKWDWNDCDKLWDGYNWIGYGKTTLILDNVTYGRYGYLKFGEFTTEMVYSQMTSSNSSRYIIEVKDNIVQAINISTKNYSDNIYIVSPLN